LWALPIHGYPDQSKLKMSAERMNKILTECLQLVVNAIRIKLGTSCEWDFDLDTIREDIRFSMERHTTGTAYLTCNCVKNLWHKHGKNGRSLQHEPRVKEILRCTFVEKRICKMWADCCSADSRFKTHGFEFSADGTALQAWLQTVPLDLAVSCQHTESKPTLSRKFLLAKNISELAPAAGDVNLVLHDGTRSVSLFNQLIQRCYTSATFYCRFWKGNEHFSGGERQGVFVLAQLVSLVADRKFAGRLPFETVLDYIDGCHEGQVEIAEFAAKAGVDIHDDGAWMPDEFLAPLQEERGQFLIAKVQLTQDWMRKVPPDCDAPAPHHLTISCSPPVPLALHDQAHAPSVPYSRVCARLSRGGEGWAMGR
jgi:hypothetical protein